MIQPGQGPQKVDDRNPPMSPQLALRVTVVGGIALALFAVVFFRLWYLQVLDSSQYAKAADRNSTRDVSIEAPRGEILGLDGQPLVKSDAVPAVSIAPTSLPVRVTLENYLHQPARDLALYRRLAVALGMSQKAHTCTVIYYYTGGYHTYKPLMPRIECLVAKGVAQSEYGEVTIKDGVSADVRAYIDERQRSFQGVIAGEAYRRDYLLGAAGAQVFGYVSAITSAERHERKFKGVAASDSVGQSGLEYEYDRYLRGTDGYEAVKVNSDNEFEGYDKGKAPQIGDNIKTSLDPSLERIGEKSLEESIALSSDTTGATGGAFVAMDPENGQVYAIGSAPTYNANKLVGGISDSEWKYLEAADHYDPLLDRAIQDMGPDGSTFKVITATAAMQSGVWSPDETFDDTGQWCFPSDPSECLHNADDEVGGVINIETALEMSDDDFFYNLGYKLDVERKMGANGGPLQDWARAYGIGEKTGIDLPNEVSGTVPTPDLYKKLYKEEVECETATGIYRYTNGSVTSSTWKPGFHRSPKHPGGCGIATSPDWTAGDNVEMAFGQGDVQVTPIQLAVVYAAIENGGTIVTPNIAQDEQTSSGTVIDKFDAPVKRRLKINPLYLNTIRRGLYLAAHGTGTDGGTSTDVMGNFKMPVYGKTGTSQLGTAAELADNTAREFSWYACYVPSTATSKPIVVVVWVEGGGYGNTSAAPVARQILSQWYYGKPGPFDGNGGI